MSQETQEIIGLDDWLQTPPGQCLLAWEHAQCAQAVADVFGFNALQLGLPELDALQANRMPHRWLAVGEGGQGPQQAPPPVALVTDFSALPFPEASLDLVALPHTLELAADPHTTLREVERVLVPEGRVVLSCLNPASLWGLAQKRARIYQRVGLGASYLPEAGEFLGYWRLRDWLRLLGFEVETVHFGCYRPAVRSQQWLERHAWMDRVGPRWWSILGAAYFIVAVKRVPGVRLMRPGWKPARVLANAPVSIAGRAGLASAGGQKDHESH